MSNTKQEYDTPKLDIIQINIEKGFATSEGKAGDDLYGGGSGWDL